MQIPIQNIYWKDVKSSDPVHLERNIFIVTCSDKIKRVAYWTGHEAIRAQEKLMMHVAATRRAETKLAERRKKAQREVTEDERELKQIAKSN